MKNTLEDSEKKVVCTEKRSMAMAVVVSRQLLRLINQHFQHNL
jgi:hypothetical protein